MILMIHSNIFCRSCLCVCICAFAFVTKLGFSLLNFCSLIIDHDASQGLRYSVAHHSPLQARHDQADAGAGLDPRPALLPAPGQQIALPANNL